MDYFVKDGKSLPYVILAKNNKHTYFRLRSDHLEVAKAKSLSNRDVLRLIDYRFDVFYEKYIKKVKNKLPDNKIILQDVEFDIIKSNNNSKRLLITDNKIIINNNFKSSDEEKYFIYESHLKTMLEAISKDVSYVLRENDIKERPIRFGYFKSKFGSYHRIKDEITLNVILAKMDINFLYYVLMHEYAHTNVFNHSKKYYEQLAQLMPDYRKYDKLLKKIAIYL